VGAAAATRELTEGSYLTDDDKVLVYVLDLREDGQAVIEDVRTGKVSCCHASSFDGWRFVLPEEAT
jgi:hypothetical protein